MTEREKVLKEINDFYKECYDQAVNGKKTELGMFSGDVKGLFKKIPYGNGVLLENDGTIYKDFYSDKPSHFPGTECRKDEYIKTYKNAGGVKIYTSEKIIMPNGCFVGVANMMTSEHTGEYCDDNGTKYSGNFSGRLFTKIMKSKKGENVITSENKQNIFTVSYTDGDKYVGLLNNGLKNGKGELFLSNGEKYTGVFENDNKQGIMKITTPCKGENKEIETSVIFKDNKIIAQNSENFAVELEIEFGIYTGGMKEGKPSGQGECVYPNGDKYDGEWSDGLKKGKGTCIWADGDRYDGEWLNNKRHGKGVMLYADGDKYDGEWVCDEEKGKGTYIWANGDRYDGEWVNGKIQGKGVLTKANGKKIKGNWINNELVD